MVNLAVEFVQVDEVLSVDLNLELAASEVVAGSGLGSVVCDGAEGNTGYEGQSKSHDTFFNDLVLGERGVL